MADPTGPGKNRILAGFDLLLEDLREALVRCYGSDLVSAAVFGSVARRTPGPESDVDLLIVARRLPAGRFKRLETFSGVETALAGRLAELETLSIKTHLSPVFRTPEELELGGPIFLDMVRDILVLVDHGEVLAGYLGRLAADLHRQGARKIRYKGAWYWDLRPDAVREGDTDE